jgi:hypothetical protein
MSLLVEYPRPEGTWDRAMAAAIAAGMVSTEQDGGAQAGYIPESARLHIVSNKFDLSKWQAILQYSTKVSGSEQSLTSVRSQATAVTEASQNITLPTAVSREMAFQEPIS